MMLSENNVLTAVIIAAIFLYNFVGQTYEKAKLFSPYSTRGPLASPPPPHKNNNSWTSADIKLIFGDFS